MQLESQRAALEARGDPVFLSAGERAVGDFLCAECGYGVTVRRVLPECPMCRGIQWEEPATSPYGGRRH